MQKEIRAHFSALCCLTRVAFVVLYTTIFLARSNECIVHTIFGQNSLIVLSTLAWPCAVLCCSVSICTNIFVYFRTEKKLASWRGHVAAHLFIFASNLKHSCQYWKMLTLFLALDTLSSISLFRAITKRYKSFQSSFSKCLSCGTKNAQ